MSTSARGIDPSRGAAAAALHHYGSGDRMMPPDRAARRAYAHFVNELLTFDTEVRAGCVALQDADRRLAGVIEQLVERLWADHGPAGLEAFREQVGPLVAEMARRLRVAPDAHIDRATADRWADEQIRAGRHYADLMADELA